MLSPYPFVLDIDELTRYIQEDIPWCMLFVDDIVLLDETKERVNSKLEFWRETLELKGFKLSQTKTEYTQFNFSNRKKRSRISVKMEEQEITVSEYFNYLGLII